MMSSFLSGIGAMAPQFAAQAALNEKIQRAMWAIYQESQLPYEQEYLSYLRSMLPMQNEYAMLALGAQQDLLPHQTMATRDQIEAARALLPYTLQEEQDRIKGRYDVRGLGLQGVDVNDRINQAVTDTRLAAHTRQEALGRDMARMGLDPASGKAMDARRRMDDDAMRTQALVMGTARREGELDDWMRRYQAAQL